MAPLNGLIDIVNLCDNFPYPDSPNYASILSNLVHFRIAAYPRITLGFILSSVSKTFEHLPDWSLDLSSSPATLTLLTGDDVASRSAAMEKTILAMRATDHFQILRKWRNEQYGVYGPDGNLLFSLERAASQLFGVITFGVHMTAYQRTSSGEYQIWVPKRSKTKQTFPGMLDNSVAGGMAVGEGPWESMIREAEEEASLPRDIAVKSKSVGAVTYFYMSGPNSGGEEGLMQPEIEFIYDLDLTGLNVELKPNDSEVEEFTCMSVEQVKECLKNGEFKPNCGLIIIDFMIRHGLVTPENEPDYLEICSRCHRFLEFPVVSFAELEAKS